MAGNRGDLKLSIPSTRRDEEAVIPLNQIHTPTSPTTEYYKSIFDRADRDHDGYITIQELHDMIEQHQLTDEPLPPHVVQRIHELSDRDHDGRLNYQEFYNMINDPKFRLIFKKFLTKYVNFVVPRRNKLETYEVDGVYEDEYSFWPPSLGMLIISIIEIAFFCVDEYHEKDSTKYAAGPMAKLFIYDPSRRIECWRFLTYMFVHIGHVHLVVNVLVQIILGIPLEMVHGWWRVLLVYFSGVVAGSLGTSMVDPNVKLAGASGGVYSMITAHIATIVLNWKEMSFPLVQLLFFLVLAGFDVGTSIYNRYWVNMEENIGYAAHFAGAIAGLLVGILVLRNLELTTKENILWWVSIAVYGILMMIALFWNIFYTDYFPKQI